VKGDEGTRFERALESLDTSLFAHVPSETSEWDRLSLLALQNACRECYGSFAYAEIGSHLGGTLQVLIADERCRSITSIDARPAAQPDPRGLIPYPENSTERMLRHLRSVPGADLGKLRTIEAETRSVSPDELPPAQLCLVDAEHTHEAALRDAHFCRRLARDDGAILFHDRELVRSAIERFLEDLGRTPHEGYPLLGQIYVVEVGQTRLRRLLRKALVGRGRPQPFLMDHPAASFPPASTPAWPSRRPR
jgi:hypothetical protein